MITNITPEQLEMNLAHYTGAEDYFRHGLNPRLIYTDGVKYLADQAGAYWLIDIVASVQHTGLHLARHLFQSWSLTVDTDKATGLVVCTNGNGKKIYVQQMEYTDFPLREVRLYCCEDDGLHVLMLSSEY